MYEERTKRQVTTGDGGVAFGLDLPVFGRVSLIQISFLTSIIEREDARA